MISSADGVDPIQEYPESSVYFGSFLSVLGNFYLIYNDPAEDPVNLKKIFYYFPNII